MRQIGIMGGTFNPPHNLHLLVAQLAGEQYEMEKVLFVPSGQPPHKKANLLPKEVRFELTAAAVSGNPLFEASSIEVDRPGVTWSIDTLRALKKIYGRDVRLNFIIGDDNLPVIRDYARRESLLKLARLVVCPRKRVGNQRNIREWRRMIPNADMVFVDCPLFPFSSTLVRDWLEAGRDVRYLVPAPVLEIIDQRGYFRK
ncbi:MAG: nicotinate-nucleotide adenylyltransferase [Candidatus Melainabacteria bacterium]|nr:nicotinate-nucleotide adenylyltransferase [Candidatus Melainabacteria bacterium]